MAIADLLKDIGGGLATGAKAVGSVLEPIAQRTAEVVSGQAPELDRERRRQAAAGIDAQVKDLESQLEIGRKYGTLTADQQKQYVDKITELYSHPSQMGTMIQKLHRAVHPDGSTYQTSLPNAIPEGGTAAADEAIREKQKANARGVHPVPGVHPFRNQDDGQYYQPMYTGDGRIVNELVEGYTPPPVKAGGKSPPLAGNLLPPDALGPDGQPISPDARNAGKSFVQYQGAWWPVAGQKPVMKTVNGNLVLLDPQTGNVLRKIGPAGTTRVTRRQTMQPGDDGQMHLVTLTSVSTPEGGEIEVTPTEEAQPIQQPKQEGQSKPAAKPGNVLPKTGAKPAAQSSPQSGAKPAPGVMPGFSNLAFHKTHTNQDTQTLESAKQIIGAVDNLLPILEQHKNEGGVFDKAKRVGDFIGYSAGFPTDNDGIIKNTALLGVIPASMWTKIGRSKYTFEVIQQHLPKPTDTPALLYDKVKWLKDNVVPDAQNAIMHPQPGDTGGSSGGGDDQVIELKRDANGKLVPK